MSLHKTTVSWDGETYFWASLDGETWYEVNQDFGPEQESDIRELFARGEQGEWRPMSFARRYLEMMKHDRKIQDVRIEQLV